MHNWLYTEIQRHILVILFKLRLRCFSNSSCESNNIYNRCSDITLYMITIGFKKNFPDSQRNAFCLILLRNYGIFRRVNFSWQNDYGPVLWPCPDSDDQMIFKIAFDNEPGSTSPLVLVRNGLDRELVPTFPTWYVQIFQGPVTGYLRCCVIIDLLLDLKFQRWNFWRPTFLGFNYRNRMPPSLSDLRLTWTWPFIRTMIFHLANLHQSKTVAREVECRPW